MRREKFYLFTYLLLLPLVAASQTDLAELNTDFDSPVLTSLTVDKPSVDVSESEQTVTFTVGFTDESGIEGTSGANWITLQSANTGAYKFAYLNQTQSPITSSPITTTATFNSSDASGNWEITQVYMRDPVGNAKWYYRSDLDALGVPASIEVVGGETDFDSPVLTSLTVDKPSVDVSESEQTVTFTVGFTDESGIEGTSGANWITLQSANTGAYKFAYLNQTQSPITSSPITTTATFNSSDASGNWEITQVYMRDPVGNAKWYYRSDLDALGVPASIEVVGGETDFDSPVLTSLTVDKPSVDVSESEQTVTFTVGFTDESGIEGTSGANWITLQSANTGAYKFAYLNQTQSPITSSPITTTATFNSSDASGNWEITQVYMRDPVGNAKWYYRSDLDALGVPTYLAVLDGEVSSTDLVLSADALNKTIVQNSSFTYPFTIRNASSETIDELTLKIYTEGAAFSSFTTGFSAWSCSITSINFSSQLQCALSSIAAGESKSSTLALIHRD